MLHWRGASDPAPLASHLEDERRQRKWTQATLESG